MKSSLEEINRRRDRLASMLRREGYLSVSQLRRRFAVSEATIRRDLRALERENRVTRTYGGALSDFDLFFTPFRQRQSKNRTAKQNIARAARELVGEGQTLFLDAGSTVYALAEVIAEHALGSLRVVTNSLPVAEVLTSAGWCETHLLGGRLLPHQLVVVGPGAGLSLSAWSFDLSFLSAEGMTPQGLWNSQDDITEFQRHVCSRSAQAVFCLDATKVGRSAPSFLLPWGLVGRVVSDAPPPLVDSLGGEARSAQWINAEAE
jgi:DeoR/GlpR family transcriptional regulator of sugar metabolism